MTNIISIRRKQYINFRMRKLIKAILVQGMEPDEAQRIAEEIEQEVCANYFVKDKRRVEQLTSVGTYGQSKAA